jgi:outer membrane protein assembly factor BamB
MSRRFATLVLLLAGVARADDWPQWLGPQRDSVWRETGLLDRFPDGGPKVLWRTPIDGGYAGPAVANGRVYVTDYVVSEGKRVNNPGGRPKLSGKERVLCLDAATGKPVWTHEYDCPYEVSYPAGPRCTPTVRDGKVYTLGTEGNLFCLDAATGKPIWSKELKKEYRTPTPIWGFCGHPLVDGKKLICVVGGEGSVAVAFDKDTGKELWKSLSAPEPGYCPPTMIEAGGTRQLLIWHPEGINSLDPETGKRYWWVELKPSYNMSIAAPRKLGDYLFVGGIGSKSVLIKLDRDKPAATEVWRGDMRKSVGPVNMTPFLEDGHIYGIDQWGQLRCVKMETGERLWETFQPVTDGKAANGGTAFLVKNGERFFIMSETGDLIIAKLSPKGYEEISRAKILEKTHEAFGRPVVWCHPAFANKCVYVRNDKETVCVSLAAE